MLEPENIKFLIVHCSDTPDDEDIGVNEIHKMHLSFGWQGVGYHKVIRRCGKIENGRPECWVGAHTFGKNKESLGVCLIGKNNFTSEQFKSLKRTLIIWKKKYHRYNNIIIKGHRDIINTKKTCPNFDVTEWCNKNNI